MICPSCGRATEEGATRCARCGQRLRYGNNQQFDDDAAINNSEKSDGIQGKILKYLPKNNEVEGITPMQKNNRQAAVQRILVVAFWTLCWLVSIAVLGLAIYKVYFWVQSSQIEARYTGDNDLAPLVNQVTLDNTQTAHEIVFYGDDGDVVFIKELQQSYLVAGGIARVTIPDSNWFGISPTSEEKAIITLTPVLTKQSGERIVMPIINFEVAAPASPLELINPAQQNTEIFTSLYTLEMKTVPNSTVLINGEDVTDLADREGKVSVNVSVPKTGENIVSVLVDTPHHYQQRKDITFIRPQLEIDMELDPAILNESTSDSMTIKGKMDPTAKLVVQTPHVSDSITLDTETGEFSFKATFDRVGENEIVFKAQKEGRKDSVLTWKVNFMPNVAEYSRKAWKMDYEALMEHAEAWTGRIFLCNGCVVSSITTDEVITVIMDVGVDTPQLIALENQTANANLKPGERYSIFAHVTGFATHEDQEIPALTGRYLSEVPQ